MSNASVAQIPNMSKYITTKSYLIVSILLLVNGGAIQAGCPLIASQKIGARDANWVNGSIVPFSEGNLGLLILSNGVDASGSQICNLAILDMDIKNPVSSAQLKPVSAFDFSRAIPARRVGNSKTAPYFLVLDKDEWSLLTLDAADPMSNFKSRAIYANASEIEPKLLCQTETANVVFGSKRNAPFYSVINNADNMRRDYVVKSLKENGKGPRLRVVKDAWLGTKNTAYLLVQDAALDWLKSNDTFIRLIEIDMLTNVDREIFSTAGNGAKFAVPINGEVKVVISAGDLYNTSIKAANLTSALAASDFQLISEKQGSLSEFFVAPVLTSQNAFFLFTSENSKVKITIVNGIKSGEVCMLDGLEPVASISSATTMGNNALILYTYPDDQAGKPLRVGLSCAIAKVSE